MGCGGSKKAQQPGVGGDATKTVEEPSVPEVTAEEMAIVQLKVLFDYMDLDGDKTVDKMELAKSISQNSKIGDLIAAAKLPGNKDFDKLDTNKDGRVSWDEFLEQLKKTATEQVEKSGVVEAAEVTAEEKAEKSLKALFKQLDSNSDDTVSKEELAAKLNAEGSEFKKDEFIEMLKKAGLQTNLAVLEQLDTNQDGRVTWEEFYSKLQQVATQETKETVEVAAATIVIEDETSVKRTCC